MKFNQELHHRRSVRLKNYDYSQEGIYFITICTHNKECLLGEIENSNMYLNKFGEVVKNCWLEIPKHYPNTILDEFVIMPNHIHGIIEIAVGANDYSTLSQTNTFKSPSKTIGAMIRGFKIGVTKWFRQNTDIYTVWQRNYYEHIIRDVKSYQNICNYIINNPMNWEKDDNFNTKQS
ncbi:MAG: hypothetical protein MUC49_02700 [Raineya sp.]|jgi:REP element-mobilizing transposase RayT|nr:hypothetical protein [Raineya sp.]